MEHNARFYPLWQKLIRYKVPARIAFIIVGVGSTIWFLIRVVPKPSRITYPCIKTTAPFMVSFFIWLGSIIGGAYLFKLLKQKNRRLNVISIISISCVIMIFLFLAGNNTIKPSIAGYNQVAVLPEGANNPYGTITKPLDGKVIWVYDADATNENSTNTVNNDGIMDHDDDVYYLPKNNDPVVIDQMVTDAILKLSAASTISDAWDSLFHYFNRYRNNKEAGYTAGEKIFIKTNNQGIGVDVSMNANLTQKDGKIWSNFPPHMAATSPYPVLSVIRQLVNVVGVPQNCIYVGDPHTHFNNIYYDIFRGEFENIHIMGVNTSKVPDSEAYGRTLSDPDNTNGKIYYADKGTILAYTEDAFFKQVTDADYMINIPALKSHIRGGITLFCKNHFGTHTRGSASHLHGGLVAPDDQNTNYGYNKYRVLVDLMGHEHLGGKTMLYLLDGLWGGPPHELHTPRKWDMAPFNGDWTSSLFAAVDPVAIASVAYDFLRTEYNGDNGQDTYANYPGTDDYLHQAADVSQWPDDITYDPENDGSPLTAMGIHEHWNDDQNKQYSRNLGQTNGILLVSVPAELVQTVPTDIDKLHEDQAVNVYPNPFTDHIHIQINLSNTSGSCPISSGLISLFDSKGSLVYVSEPKAGQDQIFRINLPKNLAPGSYILNFESKSGNKEINVSKRLLKR